MLSRRQSKDTGGQLLEADRPPTAAATSAGKLELERYAAQACGRVLFRANPFSGCAPPPGDVPVHNLADSSACSSVLLRSEKSLRPARHSAAAASVPLAAAAACAATKSREAENAARRMASSAGPEYTRPYCALYAAKSARSGVDADDAQLGDAVVWLAETLRDAVAAVCASTSEKGAAVQKKSSARRTGRHQRTVLHGPLSIWLPLRVPPPRAD